MRLDDGSARRSAELENHPVRFKVVQKILDVPRVESNLKRLTFVLTLERLSCAAAEVHVLGGDLEKRCALRSNLQADLPRNGARVERDAPDRRKDSGAADNPMGDGPLLEVGQFLMEKWSLAGLLITLGEHGMMLFARDSAPYHTPTRAREVFDVSGAGDTAIALYTLAVCAGATPREAAEISNHASGVVVAKLGTATLEARELIASFAQDAS